MNHNGDFKTAAKELAHKGFGKPPESASNGEQGTGDRKKPTEKRGTALDLGDPEPADVPVDGAELLDSIVHLLERFIVLPREAAVAIALWIVHTYLMGIWWLSPILMVNSPTKRCGKTNLLKLVARLVRRGLSASNISTAALFRTIEAYRPTLLLDEAETFLKDNEDLRGIVDAGHERETASVIRTVGDQHEPRVFSTWCAKFLSLIGKLPDTLMDRSIIVAMRRKTKSEHVERLRGDRLCDLCLPLKRQLVRWAADHADELRDADPDVPAVLNDRAADNWRPLLAIADAVGGDWPQCARDAAVTLSGDDPEEDTTSIQLLWHIHEVLADRDVCASSELVRELSSREDWPWATFGRSGKGLTANALARLLKPFGVRPDDLKIEGRTKKGYRKDWFEDAWTRYPLPQPRQRNSLSKTGLSGFPNAIFGPFGVFRE